MSQEKPRPRDIIAEGYNLYPNDLSAVKRHVRMKGKEYGFGPMLIIALIGLAIQLFQLWRNWNKTEAPTEPLPGEPACQSEDDLLQFNCDGLDCECDDDGCEIG